ncbi:MAG: hypothetical protein MHMPM18_003361 [Marteilia pararefringens]
MNGNDVAADCDAFNVREIVFSMLLGISSCVCGLCVPLISRKLDSMINRRQPRRRHSLSSLVAPTTVEDEAEL